jgi:hypothetical protein
MAKRIFYETTETITRKKKKWVEIDTDFTQIYSCINEISSEINSPTSWKLLFWLLANETRTKNVVTIEQTVWEKFNEFLESKRQSVSYAGFKKCIQELHKAGALSRFAKGKYYFNPYIFWREDQAERVEFIKAENQEAKHLNYKPVVAELKIV